ncbi:MAG: DNA-protecting protein DprA [Candidatus Omnitrophica bacterium]|nr:DNA-protecting protein DprA [Candidatus Omnitrophota bacterium]
MKQETKDLILLNMIEGFGSRTFHVLIQKFGVPSNILGASEAELKNLEALKGDLHKRISRAASTIDLQAELDLIESEKVSIVTIFDQGYPENLRQIPDAPIALYVKGELCREDIVAVAVIGSRRASQYGLSASESLSAALVSCGLTVVSGMARGIDSAAHKGALKAGGRTIAILGSGLANIYPPENKGMAERISENGALISEFPMRAEPKRQNFPMRNRIISGLSLGVVVVEAARRSGALITANLALEQGREVFAVPGKINSLTSTGTHSLIKQGAKLINNVDDILEELAPQLEFLKKDLTKIPGGTRPSNIAMTSFEERLYKLLSDEPKHIDRLSSECDIAPGEMTNALMGLQIKALVKELPGKNYVAR